MSRLTTNYSSLYSVNLTYKPDNKNKSTVKSYISSKLPKCTCFVCKQKHATKNLSKNDRDKYKSKVHPICNQCRKKLSKDLTRYKAILRSYYISIS